MLGWLLCTLGLHDFWQVKDLRFACLRCGRRRTLSP